MRVLASAIVVLASVTACTQNNESNETVVMAVVNSTTNVQGTIDADPNLRMDLQEGIQVEGIIMGGAGQIQVRGWRSSAQDDASSGTFFGFTEKLFLNYSNWQELDVIMNGDLVVTRHNIDFGRAPGAIDDANRTTTYQGLLIVGGGAEGDFDIQIHSQATGNSAWTCGTVNDDGYGVGPCF